MPPPGAALSLECRWYWPGGCEDAMGVSPQLGDQTAGGASADV
ncbi:hypothetical protein FrEUN1fDRAFT_5064 [Parafrankia sp. EUN1f]|nr:hypothetical protein FrEUN1fDRAFT_5064 [Parafrankia sp. EUN1f]